MRCYNETVQSEEGGDGEIEIIPAIDLRGGQCVRLYQGDYSRETVFSAEPLDVALKWQSVGAPRLHIVDLDGAAEGEPRNLDIVKKIAEAMLIPTQLGGGIRTMSTLEEVLKAGVERVVLGTSALKDPEMVREACSRFRESVIISVDVQNGRMATEGWREQAEEGGIADFAREMVRLGVRRFVYTDITRDGTLTEPNFAAVSEFIDSVRVPVVAAGGIASINHLKVLAKLGAEGAIVGRAVYTGDINLKQALEAVSRI